MMEINSAGVVLSYYRDKYKLTLEKVCSGICSAATLSRIEKGKRCVDSLTNMLLLERIGKEVYQFELLLNDEDYDLWRARESICEAVHKGNYSVAQEQILAYRTMKNIAPDLHEQFCIHQEIVMKVEICGREQDGRKQDKIKKEISESALRALRLTKPAYEFGADEAEQLYTSTEIELILLLAHYGEYRAPVCVEHTLLRLFRYVDYYYIERRKQAMGSRILIELTELEQRMHNDGKVLAYIDNGIDFIAQGREIAGLDRLHFLRAQVLMRGYEMGLSDSEKKREIQKECLMAYSICEVFDDKLQMKKIEEFCEVKLGWQITRLEM